MGMVVFAKRPTEPPWGSSDLDHLQGVPGDSAAEVRFGGEPSSCIRGPVVSGGSEGPSNVPDEMLGEGECGGFDPWRL